MDKLGLSEVGGLAQGPGELLFLISITRCGRPRHPQSHSHSRCGRPGQLQSYSRPRCVEDPGICSLIATLGVQKVQVSAVLQSPWVWQDPGIHRRPRHLQSHKHTRCVEGPGICSLTPNPGGDDHFQSPNWEASPINLDFELEGTGFLSCSLLQLQGVSGPGKESNPSVRVGRVPWESQDHFLCSLK